MRLDGEEQGAIAREWLKKTLERFPPQTLQFLVREKDPFRNPVGLTLKEQIAAAAAELLGAMDRGKLSHALEAIVRIGAVQDAEPSESLAFLFLLKEIIRQRWQSKDAEELRVKLERRIDEAVLLAFDLYVQCREKIYEVKADEARRRVAQLERIYAAGPDRG